MDTGRHLARSPQRRQNGSCIPDDARRAKAGIAVVSGRKPLIRSAIAEMSRHDGEIIIITGGGGGLGRAYAERLASEGARIAVAEIDGSTGRRTAEELKRSGHDAMFIETDVSSETATQVMADRVISEWGRIDGLIANAGLANSVGGASYNEISVAQWDRLME